MVNVVFPLGRFANILEGGVKLKVDKSAVIKDMTDATPSK